MEGQAIISYRDVEIDLQAQVILSGVNFDLRAGEFVYLTGKVGSGKSTFLKTIYGETEISDGTARVLDYDMRTIRQKDIPSLRRKLGIVFQDFQLLTDRTVYENLKFVLNATGWKNRTETDIRISEVLAQVEMENKGYKMPNELSGGEQQRIVIARAILNRPKIILADEPTGNLDADTGRRITRLLHEICREGTAVIMTTHNLALLDEFPGKVCCCREHRLVTDDNS